MLVSTTMAGMTLAVPNVCLVPAPPAPPIPTPFPSIGQCATAQAATCTLRVKILNKPVLTQKSKVMKTNGDEAGVNGGVMSGMFGGPCGRTQTSMKVNAEGTPIVTNLQAVGSNGASPNAQGMQLVPSQVKVICMG